MIQFPVDVHCIAADHALVTRLIVTPAPIVGAVGGHAVAGLPAGLSLQLALLVRCSLRGPYLYVVCPGFAIAINAARIGTTGAGVDMLWIVLWIVDTRSGTGTGTGTWTIANTAAMLAREIRIPL